MIEGLDETLEGRGRPGLRELRCALEQVLGGHDATVRLVDQRRLKSCVYRLTFQDSDGSRSLVVKRLSPVYAERNRLTAQRWLPAVGLGEVGPRLLASVADPTGESVWHIYEDFGDSTLDTIDANPELVRATVEVVATIHARFAEHALLPECRRFGQDLGIDYYISSVHEAKRALEGMRRPEVELSPERIALRDRLLQQIQRLVDEQPRRERGMKECGGPDTLLHGDLWTCNAMVLHTGNGPQIRLIDWDHAGVGPISYDLSSFLCRFPSDQRWWILDFYVECMSRLGWRLPTFVDWNHLFETAECSRLAHCVIWPAIYVVREQAEWAFEELESLDEWFVNLKPVLPPAPAWKV